MHQYDIVTVDKCQTRSLQI